MSVIKKTQMSINLTPEEEEFKKIHNGDLRTLLAVYWANLPLYKSVFFCSSVVLTIIIHIYIQITGSSLFGNIEILSDKLTSIMPNILGFNLGGYVLLIALNSETILDEITTPKGKNVFSLFQKTSAVFAFSILIQAISIILGFSFSYIIELGKSTYLPDNIAGTLNYLASVSITLFGIYGILLIPQIVLNIFNFSQTLHFFIRVDKR